MQPSASQNERFDRHYITVTDALCKIARAYFFLGRLDDARHLLQTSLQILHTGKTKPQLYLKPLLLSGQILIVDYLLTRGGTELPLAAIQQARQIAEQAQDQQSVSDALSLLGQAHYFATILTRMNSGASPDTSHSQKEYTEALAYQQQALKIREDLHDTRGISESYFQIGVVYERQRQYEQAQAYYTKAHQLADQHGHLFEKTEPARHFAVHALREGDLDQALTLALQAVKEREEAGFKPYLPLDHLLLRDIYQAQGETAHAQSHTEIALALAEEMGLKTLVSSMPDVRNVLLAQQKQP